jgi:NAD(P)-dependent dehydrogenase (short-subunit alcohol dehydrogenase family)
MGRLTGKTAIVSGAGGGLGSASARRLAAEGAQVVLADILLPAAEKVAEEIRASGGAAVALHLDLAELDSIQGLIAKTLERYGKLDVLFNNAAETRAEILNNDGALEYMDPDLWDHVFRVNTRGTMLMIKHALPSLLKTGNASIINTSSGAALLGDLFRVAYASSKAAVNTLTLYVAAQYGKRGIRCNVISPGMVPTENSRRNQGHELAMFERHHLTPYLGNPEDIAAMAAFLASDDGRFVNGQILAVDGGIATHFAHVADNRDMFEAHRTQQGPTS